MFGGHNRPGAGRPHILPVRNKGQISDRFASALLLLVEQFKIPYGSLNGVFKKHSEGSLEGSVKVQSSYCSWYMQELQLP